MGGLRRGIGVGELLLWSKELAQEVVDQEPDAQAAEDGEDNEGVAIAVVFFELLEGVGRQDLAGLDQTGVGVAVDVRPVPHFVSVADYSLDGDPGGDLARVPRVFGVVAVVAAKVACFVDLTTRRGFPFCLIVVDARAGHEVLDVFDHPEGAPSDDCGANDESDGYRETREDRGLFWLG